MSESFGSAQLAVLENQVSSLRMTAGELIERINAQDGNVLANSMPAFATGAFGTGSELASTGPLAFNNAYAPLTLQYQTLMYAYKSQPVLQNAIDMPIQDALRGGLDFRSDQLDKDDIKELENLLEDINFYHQVKTLEEWAKLFGGSAMVLNTDQDPEKPLSINDIKLDQLKFYAASRWEMQSPKRFAEFYTFYGQRFHKSRVYTVAGKEAPFQIRWMLQDWGLSDMEKMIEPFNIYLRTQNAIYDLLREAKVDIYKFEGFLAQLSSQKGTQMAMQRVQIANMTKNTGNALVMDAKDDYVQKQVTFSGLAEMSVQNRISLASATRIPINKLFGTGAVGFSSGEDDIENYNAMVESEVREHLRPTLRKLIDLVAIALWGEDYDLSFEFKPLRVMSSEQEEQIKTSKHARYFQDMQAGMLTPKEYMELQQKEKIIPIETEVARGAEPEPLMMAMGAEQKPGEPGQKKEQGDQK
jgi:phage-related protein (TIGR01555 family)